MEYMDVINEKDEVIRIASQADVYAEKLLYRIVHILIFHPDGRIALQRRSQTKSFCPGHWSTSVGGHVQTGESYEQAARREYEEELGRVGDTLEFLGTTWYSAPTGRRKIFGTFLATTAGPFTLRPEEVEDVQFFPLDSVSSMIDAGELFNPELVFLLEKYKFI